MTTKLNYQLLQKLVDPDCNHSLEIVKVGVTRFGDDSSDIYVGQTVPFVANVKFVVTDLALEKVRDDCGRIIAPKDTLFAINNRAEVVTAVEDLEIDSDSVARWVSDHYEFTFHVRGIDRSPFQPHRRDAVDLDQFETFEPWLQEINTIAVRGELIDIDFDVKPKVPHARRITRVPLLSLCDDAVFKEATLRVRLEVEGKYESVANLRAGKYWIALHSEDDPDLKLCMKVETVTVGHPHQAPPADATKKSAERRR